VPLLTVAALKMGEEGSCGQDGGLVNEAPSPDIRADFFDVLLEGYLLLTCGGLRTGLMLIARSS